MSSLAVATGVTFAAAPDANADTMPTAPEPATVSNDALPTVQIDGIVWSQVVIGNTVYVGGSFSNARPLVLRLERTSLLAQTFWRTTLQLVS